MASKNGFVELLNRYFSTLYESRPLRVIFKMIKRMTRAVMRDHHSDQRYYCTPFAIHNRIEIFFFHTYLSTLKIKTVQRLFKGMHRCVIYTISIWWIVFSLRDKDSYIVPGISLRGNNVLKSDRRATFSFSFFLFFFLSSSFFVMIEQLEFRQYRQSYEWYSTLIVAFHRQTTRHLSKGMRYINPKLHRSIKYPI